MQKIAEIADRNKPIIVIGQSMGGVIANSLHKKQWDITIAIYIGSPLHGARLLNHLDSNLPTVIRDWFYKSGYDHLLTKEQEPAPPHPYHTISMAWPFTDFDGCVYKDEATIEEDKHTHLGWADHRTVFLNPRLWWCVGEILHKHISEDLSLD